MMVLILRRLCSILIRCMSVAPRNTRRFAVMSAAALRVYNSASSKIRGFSAEFWAYGLEEADSLRIMYLIKLVA